MRIFSELKRRKVIQTGVLYVVASWVLLQVAALLLGMLEVPAWGLKLVFVILLIGFPLALMLSWMHQITPEGIRRESDAPPAAVDSAATAAEAPRAKSFQPAPALGEGAADTTDHSIAVLPFANMSDDTANEYFADGLSEELLNLLSRIPALRVVARTSSFAFKGRSMTAAAIARELNVAHLLEGSVRKAGSRIRITAQLIRASDSSHVWSQSFDRDLSDIFAVQDDIAAAVVGKLEITLLHAAVPKSRQTDPRAYACYLQGKHFFELQSAQGYEQAEKALDSALSIDPEFGPAWAVLGALYWSEANNSVGGYEEGSRKARAATEKALALDPDQAEPLALLCMLDLNEKRDAHVAMQRLEHALRLESRNPRVLTRAAVVATRNGRLGDAIRYGEQALGSDPLSPLTHAVLSGSYYRAGRLDEAEALRRRVLALSPGWLSGHYHLGLIRLARNDAPAALELMQQEPSRFWRSAGLALVHHALGRDAESRAALDDLKNLGSSGIAFQVAEAHAYRGEADAAFEWLERSVETHDAGLNYLGADPLLRNLHGDPRWGAFIRRLTHDG